MKATILIIVIFFLECPVNAYSQNYRQANLNVKEKKEGIVAKYIYEIKEGGLGGNIILYKNKRYHLSEGTDMDYIYSIGRWKQKNDTIILESVFSKSGLPIKINYIDTVDAAQNQLFHVVKNEKGDPLTDAFIQINNDTTECLPLGNLYTSKPSKVDSVRIRFERGYLSNWERLEHKPYKALSIIVLTALDMEHFLIENQLKFKKKGDHLVKIKE